MNLEDLHALAEQYHREQAQYEHRIVVCMGTACQSAQSEQVITALDSELKARGLEKQCAVRAGGCRGLCAAGPLITVEPGQTTYQGVKPDDAPALIDSLGGEPIERLLCDTTMPFFTRQKRVVLEYNGLSASTVISRLAALRPS